MKYRVAPLRNIPSDKWLEKVWGDPDRPGAPFVIRIHNNTGYVVLPLEGGETDG
jgi:hypothetical protein